MGQGGMDRCGVQGSTVQTARAKIYRHGPRSTVLATQGDRIRSFAESRNIRQKLEYLSKA